MPEMKHMEGQNYMPIIYLISTLTIKNAFESISLYFYLLTNRCYSILVSRRTENWSFPLGARWGLWRSYLPVK
jgi:hypothetical protein